MPDQEENILVIPRSLFDRLGGFQGLNFDVERFLPALLDPANNLFLPRGAAEQDPSHKQIIPYLLIRHAGCILHYTRGKSGGEARLHAKGSIGIGGHINDGDAGEAHFNMAAYQRAVERELNEELDLPHGYKQRIAALLNDDESEVGRVHLGVVHVVEVPSPDIASREDAIRDLEFLTPAELLPRRERLEAWSQICLGGLDRFLSLDV
jgi:predicted NUDIX family phosphoesterase